MLQRSDARGTTVGRLLADAPHLSASKLAAYGTELSLGASKLAAYSTELSLGASKLAAYGYGRAFRYS